MSMLKFLRSLKGIWFVTGKSTGHDGEAFFKNWEKTRGSFQDPSPTEVSSRIRLVANSPSFRTIQNFTVLEIGAGYGRILDKIVEEGTFQVIALEPDHYSANILRSKGINVWETTASNLKNCLPLPPPQVLAK